MNGQGWNYLLWANLLLLLQLNPAPLSADDLYYTFDNSYGTADYLLGTRLVEDASSSSSQFSMSKVLSANVRSYFESTHTQIFPYADYSSTQGEIGLQFRHLAIEDNQIFAGSFLNLIRYHDVYSYYNSAELGLYLKWKYYLKATQLFTSGIDLNLKRYDELAEASNTETEVYLLYNHSFKSKTSVYLRNSLGLQDFWSQTVLEGQGRDIVSVEIDDIPNNLRLSSEIRISQSLGSKLGATVWLENQILLNQEGGSLVLQDGMNNPFIDNYRWEGPSTALRLTYRPNHTSRLTFSHSWVEKSYLDVPVYEFDFALLDYVVENETYVDLGFDRNDDRQTYQISYAKTFSSNVRKLIPEIGIALNAGITSNHSNDPIYDYKSQSVGISLKLNN